MLKPEILRTSNKGKTYSCAYPEKLEQEDPWTSTHCPITPPTCLQQATPTLPAVRHIEKAPPLERLPTPFNMRTRWSFRFPGIGAEGHDMEKPRKSEVSLHE